MGYHLIRVRMASIKTTRNKSVGKDVEKRYTVAENINWWSHGENSTEVPQKTERSYKLAISKISTVWTISITGNIRPNLT